MGVVVLQVKFCLSYNTTGNGSNVMLVYILLETVSKTNVICRFKHDAKEFWEHNQRNAVYKRCDRIL